MDLSTTITQQELLAITIPTVTTSTVPLILMSLCVLGHGSAFQPQFTEQIVNLTISRGRDATFRCFVQHLGGYRVGWVKADTKAIQAIHDHVITHNPRISVSHTDHSTWNLHIHHVQEEDRGAYMCQINTDPMKYQIGLLEVVVSPDFIDEETSGDVMIPESGTVKLMCKARGHPTPTVRWRREDGQDIVIRDLTGHKTRVKVFEGPILLMHRIMRPEMGTYLCIASNGVPPTISKRITVGVHFHPVIQVPNQLVGTPLGTDVTLECNVEASPRSINYWMRTTGEMVISSNKYDVSVKVNSLFEMKMIVILRNTQKSDMGSYRCIAKNSLGEVESNIRLYEISGSVGIYHPFDEDDYDQQFGSAEREHDEELNSGVKGGRPSLQMSIPPPRAPHVTLMGKNAAGGLALNCAGNYISIISIIIFTISSLI